MSYIILNAVPQNLEHQRVQAIVKAIGYQLHIDNNTLLWKTRQVYVKKEKGEINLVFHQEVSSTLVDIHSSGKCSTLLEM